MTMLIKCSNCEAASDPDDAMEAGWIPYYWDENSDCEKGIVCAACIPVLGLLADNFGEMCLPLKEA